MTTILGNSNVLMLICEPSIKFSFKIMNNFKVATCYASGYEQMSIIPLKINLLNYDCLVSMK
jgi:hypothetical protein